MSMGKTGWRHKNKIYLRNQDLHPTFRRYLTKEA